MKAPVITLANNFHRDKAVVRLRFEKIFPVVAKVKLIKGAAWSQNRRFWHIAKSDFKMKGAFRCKMRNLLDDLEI
jgi:hypothetical protein